MNTFSSLPEHSFLAGYHAPAPSFMQDEGLPPALAPLWEALAEGQVRAALGIGRELAQHTAPGRHSLHAAIRAGMAHAELRLGNMESARRLAEESIGRLPEQGLAQRILLKIMEALHEDDEAYLILSSFQPPAVAHGWDEPLSPAQQRLATAALAWRLRDWEGVSGQLERLYPGGPGVMPEPVLQDWFRLALYRGRPKDAAAAAEQLILNPSLDYVDDLLQTLVQRGWTAQALPLYRMVYADAPGNALIRRRLVAMCLKEGALEEARRLVRAGALEMAA